MEEFIGALWDKLITRTAYRGFPKARVDLKEMERIAPIFFRALGGDAGLSIRAGTATAHGAQRKWLERVAGISERVELAWTDETSLHLPAWLDGLMTKSEHITVMKNSSTDVERFVRSVSRAAKQGVTG